VLGAASLAAVGAFSLWLFGDGTARAELDNELRPTSTALATIAAGDPSSPGKYPVKTLTYGSGDDRHRREFAADVAIKTETVDGSHVLKGWDGMTGWARTRFWGFDDKQLPINGRVWYPDGEGPFPLVLVVHGNHLSSDFSDPGYEYLGRLLASRGYLFTSVDENFLNSMETDLVDGLDSENNARGWMLLEHLRVWHAWNKDDQNPFYGQVDTARIALVGHSRGGEAVAHAAAFNRLKYNPDDARARFDYGYSIKSIVAIEPADGQYRPAGAMTPLENINYFTIQGAHDSDVSSFLGLKQYDRVAFSGDGDWFKAAVYVYGANHGQFNTTWGAYDVSIGLGKHVINTRALLDAETQRRVLEVYLSAFLDCTLRDVRAYRQLFRDARAGAAWLPKTVYVTEYADATCQQLATFDEDIDLTTGTLASSQIESENLTRWREQQLALRAGPGDNRVAILGWDRDKQPGEPGYRIGWPADVLKLDDDSVLSFSLADANEDPSPDEDDDNEGKESSESKKKEEEEEEDSDEPIDFSVELTDAAGQKAVLPLSHFALLRPQIETMFLKLESLHSDGLSEPVRQTFLFPLADFKAVNQQFDPKRAVQLRLVFDRTRSGVVVLDEVGVGKTP
jgi:dienelactone hydrolase